MFFFDACARRYFDYDSKKSGASTICHLRFSEDPITDSYLIPDHTAQFVACHFPYMVNTHDMMKKIAPGGTFLMNSTVPAAEIWDTLPLEVQQGMLEKDVKFYVVNAQKVAREAGMGRRVNTIMQACFFALSNILPKVSGAHMCNKQRALLVVCCK